MGGAVAGGRRGESWRCEGLDRDVFECAAGGDGELCLDSAWAEGIAGARVRLGGAGRSGRGRGAPARVDNDWVDLDDSAHGVYLDCELDSGPDPNYTWCGGDGYAYIDMWLGYDGSYAYHDLSPWSFSEFPANVQVLYADLAMYVNSASTSNAITVNAYRQTRAHTYEATWNTYDGSNAWTTPGGDYDSSTVAASASNVGSASNTWVHFYPTALVQQWLDGTAANDGMVLKEPSDNVNQVIDFATSDASSNNPTTPTASPST